MERDNGFQMATSNLRFGIGVTREVGMDLADWGLKRVMLLTDPNLRELPPVQTVIESLRAENVDFALFDRVHCEPTEESFKEAIAFATDGNFDGFVAVGGGSTMDTAKVANLYSCHPDEFLTYVNAPLGQAKPVPGPLKPLVAIPTTAGTGSETTGVAIFDFVELNAKTGIANRMLKPTLGIVDAENTRGMPPVVAASTGLDVLAHALESYTTLPSTSRPRPERPILRPAYQGSNPISDIWVLATLKLVAEYLERAVKDPSDDEAREKMIMASAFAGMGFGNSGVHLCHGMSYPVAGMVKGYRPEGYVTDHDIVPHGMAVALNAPGVFRFTAPGCPQRHLTGAEALGADISGASPEDAGEVVAQCIIGYLKRLGMPNGLGAVGFTEQDIPKLVKGALPQDRVNKLSPVPVDEAAFTALFKDNLVHWSD